MVKEIISFGKNAQKIVRFFVSQRHKLHIDSIPVYRYTGSIRQDKKITNFKDVNPET